MKYGEVARKLPSLGCIEVPHKETGSHRKWRNPATNRTTVVPDRRGKVKSGTVRQLGIDWVDFENA